MSNLPGFVTWSYSDSNQCCHSEKRKTLDGPIKKTKKTQGRISLKFSVISDFFPEKCNFYPKNPNFSPKNFLLSTKISDDLSSSTSNFHLIFANNFSINSMNNSLLFGKKHTKNVIFLKCLKNPRKTQALLKSL